MRVLYVDDDRINCLLFEEACRVAGDIEVQVAADGAEGIDLAGRQPPDVLVIDLHLPDTDGFALLPRLRALPACSAVPAFLCTADEAGELRLQAEAAGFLGCWTKPIELRPMLAALAALRPDAERR